MTSLQQPACACQSCHSMRRRRAYDDTVSTTWTYAALVAVIATVLVAMAAYTSYLKETDKPEPVLQILSQ